MPVIRSDHVWLGGQAGHASNGVAIRDKGLQALFLHALKYPLQAVPVF